MFHIHSAVVTLSWWGHEEGPALFEHDISGNWWLWEATVFITSVFLHSLIYHTNTC